MFMQQSKADKSMPLILCHFSMWSSTKWSLMCSFSLESLSWRNNVRNLISKKARMKYGLKSQYNLLTRCTAGVTMEIEPEGSGSDHKIHPSISLVEHQPDKFRTCDWSQFSLFCGCSSGFMSTYPDSVLKFSLCMQTGMQTLQSHTRKWIYERVKTMHGYNLLSAEQDAASQLDTHTVCKLRDKWCYKKE